MKKNTRFIRINEEVRREISNIIREELKDPSIPEMTSVTEVDVTRDLKYAKVYISVFADKEKQQEALEGLKRAKGFIRREVASRLNLRNTPELLFVLDTSIEYAVHMTKIINDISTPSNESEKKGD